MRKKFIYIFILFLIFSLSSCNNNQEVKQNNIENNKNEKNISKKEIKKEGDFELKKFDKDLKKIGFIDLNNSLYSKGGGDNLKEKIKILSSSGETLENKLKATFLESFIGDYDNALKKREDICKDNLKSDFCKKVKLDFISFRPVDIKGNYLEDVKISIDGIEHGPLKSKDNLELENKFIHRIKISKEGYLDFYKKNLVDTNKKETIDLVPRLLKADVVKEINNKDSVEIKTEVFTFNIDENTFKTKKGNLYFGKVKLYVFDINKRDGDLSVLNLDVFSKDGSYIGDSMITFGMPLIKAYDNNGNELKIGKEIIGKGRILDRESLENIDLKNVAKNVWLSRKELNKYNIPNFWHLDQDKGVWIESEMKILNSNGDYEFKLK